MPIHSRKPRSRRKRGAKIVGVFLLAHLFTTYPATADTRAITDPDDVEDVMDLAEASHGHVENEPKIVAHTLRTYEAWTPSDFELAVWSFSGRNLPSRHLAVAANNPDGSFRAQMINGNGRVIGYGNAYQLSETTLRVEFPVKLLGPRVEVYSWRVALYRPCSREPNVQCEPVAPDTTEKGVRHRLR